MRRLLSLAGWLVFATIVAATVVVIAIDVGFQRDRLRSLAVAAIRDELGIEVAIERADGRASRGLELRGVRLGPEAAPLAEIERLRLEWRIWRWLLDEERRIDRIEIDGATVHLEREGDGRWRTLDDILDRLASRSTGAASGEDTEAPPFVVAALALEDSSIEFVLPARPESRGVGPVSLDRLVFAVEGRASDYRSQTQAVLPVKRAGLELTLVEATHEGTQLPVLETARVAVELTESGRVRATIDASGPGLALEASLDGTTTRPGPVRFALRAEDLARLSPWIAEAETLRGRATLAGEVSGLRLDPAIELDPTALVAALSIDAAVDGLPPFQDRSLPPGLLTIQGRGRLDAGRIRIDEAVVEHPRGLRAELSGAGSRERFEDVSVALRLDDPGFWASALAPEAGTISGERIELQADLDGPVEAPVGRLIARARGLAVGDLAPTDLEVTLERKDGDEARLRALAWEAGSTSRRGDANGAPLRLDAVIDPVLREATVEASFDGPFVARAELFPKPLAGRFDLAGSARLVQDGLHVDARLHGTDVIVDATPVGPLDVAARTRAPATAEALAIELLELTAGVGSTTSPRARLEQRAFFAIDASRRWQIEGLSLGLSFGPPGAGQTEGEPSAAETSPGIAIDASGTAGRPESARVSLRAVPVEAIAQLLDEVSPVTGRLSLEARVDTQGDVVVSHGDGRIEDPTIAGQVFDTASLTWGTESGSIGAHLSLVTAQSVPLDLTAQLPPLSTDPRANHGAVFEGATFVAELDGFDLALLAPSTPRTLRDPAGRLRGRLEGRIEDGRPRLRGRFDVAEAGITVPLLRRRFAPIEGYATLEDDRLELHELRLGSDEAGATLHAVVDLEDDALPIDAELVLRRLPISRSALLHADVDGQLVIAGSLAEPKVTGHLVLPGLQARVPAAEDPLLREIRLTASPQGALVEPTEDANGFVTSSHIDVRLEVPGDARIRGQGAHLYVKGDARLVSRPGETLRVFGEGEVVHGTYTLQGRRFQVRRGSVQLVGDRDVDPVLDIEARLPTGDIVAIVDVTGRLSSPVVRLRSEPARSEQDVLAYLLFGRPADEVGASQSGSMNAAAARLVAGVAERELRDLLGDAMPVDSIEIGADDEGNTSELGFGKYLQPNLYLRYVHVLGDEPADRVGVEYRVNDLISVGSSVSTTGDAGLDLILRHDF